jgi:predicted aspartyl protease
LAKVIGYVDDLGRPVVRIEVPGRDGFLVVVDTGFNRSLLMQASEVEAMGFTITENTVRVELGTTVGADVHRAVGTIFWLGRTMRVDVLVSNEPAIETHRVDTARALIGAELLTDCLLLVDYRTRVVEIEEQD